MYPFIPFIGSQTDCKLLNRHYQQSVFIRVGMADYDNISSSLPQSKKLWIDPGVDAYHYCSKHSNVSDFFDRVPYLKKYKEYDLLTDSNSIKKPNIQLLSKFVFSVLDACNSLHPSWITVPQLPVVTGTSINKINKALAELSGEWKRKTKYDGKFILPLIFTHRDQLKNRTHWILKINQAKLCFQESGAHLLWVVDSDLDDDSGIGNLNIRLSKLIQFHKELKDEFESSSLQFDTITGPYWAMNLILWARKLCKYSSICLGSSFKYHIPGGYIPPAKKIRVVISPLKRLVVVGSKLKNWLDKTTSMLSPEDPAYKQICELKEKYSLINKESAKNQIANFYSNWTQILCKIDPHSRPLTLYQEFSSAYILGSQLDKLPIDGTKEQEAGLLAQQLMLCCL